MASVWPLTPPARLEVRLRTDSVEGAVAQAEEWVRQAVLAVGPVVEEAVAVLESTEHLEHLAEREAQVRTDTFELRPFDDRPLSCTT